MANLLINIFIKLGVLGLLICAFDARASTETATVATATVAEASSAQPAAVSPETAPALVLDAKQVWSALKIKPYGFVRLDAIYDDSRMQNSQFAFHVLSEDPSQNPTNDERLTIHPRLTRFGLEFGPHEVSDGKVSGKIEVDFQNGGRESRAIPRMRHAFLALSLGPVEFLAGQTSDLISPLFPAANNDGLMWNAGNLGDRHPQARLTLSKALDSGKISAAVAGLMTGAVDARDLDENLELDGFEAARPTGQALVSVEKALWTKTPLQIGAWAHTALTKSNREIGSERATRFTSLALGAHLSLPLQEWLVLEGEAWFGQDLSDVRGGIGQGVNGATGKEIRSKGGWGQVMLKPTDVLQFHVGATIDNPNAEDLSNGMRRENFTVFGIATVRPWPVFQVTLEYIYWRTRYVALADGTDNRLDLYFVYRF